MTWYRTGAVTVTNASTDVVGVGTDFVTFVDAGEGVFLPDGKLYEISAIVSPTLLRLRFAYAGTTASGAAYEVVPIQGYNRDLAHSAKSLIDLYNQAPVAAEASAAAAEVSATTAVQAKDDALAIYGSIGAVQTAATAAQTSANASGQSASESAASATLAGDYYANIEAQVTIPLTQIATHLVATQAMMAENNAFT